MKVLRLVTALSLLAVMASTAAGPATAQEKPANQTRRLLPLVLVLPQFQQGRERPARDPNAPKKICFWRDTSGGTPFGKSGFCDTPSSSAVGSQCRCNASAPGQRPDGRWVGQVMLAPQSDGSSQVVR